MMQKLMFSSNDKNKGEKQIDTKLIKYNME